MKHLYTQTDIFLVEKLDKLKFKIMFYEKQIISFTKNELVETEFQIKQVIYFFQNEQSTFN